MTIILDPDGNETAALQSCMHESPELSILEIGCGTGRLTFQIAPRVQKVIAIDPNTEKIAAANKNMSDEYVGKVDFINESLEEYSFSQ